MMAVAKPKHEYDIHETPEVCGGYPCIGMTRIPVRLMVEAYRATGSVDKVAAFYNHVSREKILEALAYYQDYPDRVDEDIERNARAWAELTSRPKPKPAREWQG